MGKKVAVAMSGGLDSSVAALLLKQQGYEVVGVTALMNDTLAAENAISGAKSVCKLLNIQHFTVDLREDFKREVINYFIEAYRNGLTPNPCIVCNKNIKWGSLRNYIKENMDVDYYATGHYSKIAEENGAYKLCKSEDSKKDQIYMLFSLSQEDLAQTLFPLSIYEKSQIREIARQYNLPCAESPESQDICFIQPPDTTQNFLIKHLGEKEGNIIEKETGKILGKHKGFYNYTYGQRKGIGVSAPYPLFVISTDAKTNTVYVGRQTETYSNELEVERINWQIPEYKNKEFKALIKIRYNSPAIAATFKPIDATRVIVEFDEPQFAITPGQVAVIYDTNNTYMIGGGWIKSFLSQSTLDSMCTTA